MHPQSLRRPCSHGRGRRDQSADRIFVLTEPSESSNRVAWRRAWRKVMSVDAIAEKLDTKLSKWKPEISREVRALVSQVIDAADNDALDVMRSRAVEQEVLDQLDEPTSR